MHTTEILEALNGLEDSPWGTWNDDHGIKAHELKKHTSKYRTHEKTIQVWHDGKNKHGYRREWFEDAWDRYLTPLASGFGPGNARNARTLTPQGIPGFPETLEVGSLDAPQPLQGNGSSGLALPNPGKDASEVCDLCDAPGRPYLNHRLCDVHKGVFK